MCFSKESLIKLFRPVSDLINGKRTDETGMLGP